MCAKKFVGPKKFQSKKMWSRNILIKRNHGLQKLCPSNSWNIHDMGKFCQDQCFLDKCDDDSWNRGSPELPLKFGQNLVSNSWDITYMDKCRQDKCCMEKMWLWELASLKEGPRNLRNLPWKFGQYRASNSWDITNKEILLIRTNVARTDVAWTNVTVTVYICRREFQEPTCKVWWKSGQ